ncbi:MAG: serine/threonine protein kinase [Planctomycetes bacterium]|nr:serine/threonine protein kinase [Planctomycetota bacterium]
MPAPSTLIGKILGGYVIQSQIGAGGMGVVYRAHDERLGRTVAIKVLPPKFRADETLRQRFLREGRTAARIDHPNVARILSAGEEDGLAYLVMEYVDGGSLQRLLEKRIRLPIATTLRIGRQIAEALQAAHKVGVMHRDVKPANVLFTKEGEPKLVDFGLAREEMSEVNLSQTGMVMGTPHYMAPEVCEGKKADARADVYALAVVLYAMIAGRLPFDGETAIAILMAHIQKPVPPIPEAPRSVAAVLARALLKDPAKRTQTGAAFAADLDSAAEAVSKQGEVAAQAAGFGPAPAPVAKPSPPPPPAAVKIPTPVSVPGGLLPTAATPSAGTSAARPRVPLVAWTAGCAAVAVLALVGIVFAFRGSHKSPTPPSAPPPVRPAFVDPVADTSSPPDAGDAAWLKDLKATTDRARRFEKDDEFAQALALWNELPTPDTRASATVAREKSSLLSRASLRAQKEIDLAPRGAAGARKCLELAAKLPPEAAAMLQAAAKASTRDWQPHDGLGAFRGVLASRDPRSAGALLAAIEAPPPGPERETVANAQLAVDRVKLALEKASAWYLSNTGTAVEIRRTDGTLVKGAIHGIDEKNRQILVRSGDQQVPVGVNDLAASELALRALDGCPSDDLVLAALDLTLFCGTPREAWPFAIRAWRRGLNPGKEREKLLVAEILPAELAEADQARQALGRVEGDTAARVPLAQAWLRRFGSFPFEPRLSALAREYIRAGGGPASVPDLSLCLCGKVTESAEGVTLRWTDADSFLADFAPVVKAEVVPGTAAALKATGDGACLLLHGLRWSDVTIEAEVKMDGPLALLSGWRAFYEHLSTAVLPADHGARAVLFPVAGEAFVLAASKGEWERMSLTIKGSHMEFTLGSEIRACDLPVTWAGELGIFFKSGLSFRFVEVRGHPEFADSSNDDEFKALAKSAKRTKGAGKSSWRTWKPSGSKGEKITVEAAEEYEWLRAANWDAGSDYRMSFVAHPWGASELALDLRADGTSRRRVMLGSDPHNGTITGGRFLVSGPGIPLPHEQDVKVVILVHDDLAQIEVNGKMAWRGHVEGLPRGGVEVGVRRGSVQLDGLRIEELEK